MLDTDKLIDKKLSNVHIDYTSSRKSYVKCVITSLYKQPNVALYWVKVTFRGHHQGCSDLDLMSHKLTGYFILCFLYVPAPCFCL